MIRLARPGDADFIRELACLSILSSLPANRQADPEIARQFVLRSYADLEQTLARDRNLLVLVEEEPKSRELTGYLMIELDQIEPSTGEKQAFMVDIAVLPDRRGRFATARLVKKASALCRARGLKYLVGVVSASNTVARGLARCLGFEEERVQIVLRLD